MSGVIIMDNRNYSFRDNSIRTYYCNRKILEMSYIFTFINTVIFILSTIYGVSLFKKDGIILKYSCDMTILIFGLTFLFEIILSVIIKEKSKVKKGRVLDPKIILNDKSYKIVKIIILVIEFFIILSFFLSIKFFSYFVTYKNGIITINKNTTVTKINVSDIKYLSVYGKIQHHSQAKSRSYDYLGVSMSYYYNGTRRVLVDSTTEKELSKINTFLEDIKSNYNFQGISVSINDLNEVNGIYQYKIVQNAKAPVFYIKTSSLNLSDIEDTDMTIASENFLNERADTIDYNDYINQ